MLRSLAKPPLAAMNSHCVKGHMPLMETKPMTSDAAVNAEEREIAWAMDDDKQREDIGMEHPKARRIERMISGAEHKREQQSPTNAPRTAQP